ncbi:hypothetical protein [Streptomyces sp. NPDC002057]|uniref:hypothetical protein n=1 Tax=Streptomyces sp. NPDC002057 TaxID=3154664 RepID=UPI00332AFDBE
MAWYEGPCRITVTGVDADWPQRAVVVVSGVRGARIEIPGEVGTVRHIDAPGWHLVVEHRHEGKWRPNIRAVRSRWETVDGVRTQTVTSKDVDWPQGNQHERNLVLRLEWIGQSAERTHELVHDAPIRAATQSTSTTPAGLTTAGPAQGSTRSSSDDTAFGSRPAASPARTTSHGHTSTSSSSPW